MKYVISPNLSKPAAFETALRVCERLRNDHVQLCMEQSLADAFAQTPDITFLPEQSLFADVDFAIAIGGDGTILQCANRILAFAVANCSPPVRLVGINTGTLGFLAAFEAHELDMLALLETGDFTVSERMMLETEICGNLRSTVLNDIYASRMNGKICDFAVYVDDRKIGDYRADGIIFSTPTGSTAYALSAGGPVMEPDLSLIEMNLICPHSLFARPMLFAPQRSIRVTYRGAGDGGLNVHVDGSHAAILHNSESFTVTGSPRTMPFVNCKGHAFYDALNGKLMLPIKRTGTL